MKTQMHPKLKYSTRHAFHNQIESRNNEEKTIQIKSIKYFNTLLQSTRLIYKKEGAVRFLKEIRKKLQSTPYYSLKEFTENPVYKISMYYS